MSNDRDALAAEVSRLYWETELSVAEIADRLGISRRALYDALIPALAGARCPECGGELVYVNRSARLAEEAECRACRRSQSVALLRELTAEAGSTLRQEAERREAAGAGLPEPPPGEGPEVEQESVAEALSPVDVGRSAARNRALVLVGAAVAGIAIGAAAALLAARRVEGRRR
jgi:hypothetical protein